MLALVVVGHVLRFFETNSFGIELFEGRPAAAVNVAMTFGHQVQGNWGWDDLVVVFFSLFICDSACVLGAPCHGSVPAPTHTSNIPLYCQYTIPSLIFLTGVTSALSYQRIHSKTEFVTRRSLRLLPPLVRNTLGTALGRVSL